MIHIENPRQSRRAGTAEYTYDTYTEPMSTGMAWAGSQVTLVGVLVSSPTIAKNKRGVNYMLAVAGRQVDYETGKEDGILVAVSCAQYTVPRHTFKEGQRVKIKGSLTQYPVTLRGGQKMQQIGVIVDTIELVNFETNL